MADQLGDGDHIDAVHGGNRSPVMGEETVSGTVSLWGGGDSVGYGDGTTKTSRRWRLGLPRVNRANARLRIFEKEGGYETFVRLLEEAVERTEARLLACCVLPNHWHLVMWPWEDGGLYRFTGWLTLTHTQRCHAHCHGSGSGHLYQGRFQSIPVQDDEHFCTVCRYVERNALCANLVERAEDWRWGSLHRWKWGFQRKGSRAAPYFSAKSSPPAA